MQIALFQTPQTIRQLLGKSLELYFFTFIKSFCIAIVLAVILFSIRFIPTDTLYHYRIGVLITDILCIILFTIILWHQQCVLHNRHESLSDDFQKAFQKLPRIFIAAIIQSLILTTISLSVLLVYHLIGQTLFVSVSNIPFTFTSLLLIFQSAIAVYLYFGFYFYLALILTENRGILNSLTYSLQLVRGQWWKTAVTQSIPWFLYFCIFLFLRGSDSILLYFLQILVFALFIPWFASNLLIQLHDLEIRKKTLTS